MATEEMPDIIAEEAGEFWTMSKQAAGAMIPAFDQSAPGVPLYLQICERIRGAILAGKLKPKTRLPSTRALAADLNASRNTIEVAFAQLEAEGFLLRKVGSGSYVAENIAESLSPPGAARSSTERPAPRHSALALSRRGNRIIQSAIDADPVTRRSFTPCLPTLDSFPFRIWHRLMTKRSRLYKHEPLLNSEAAGYQPLREAVADYLVNARAVKCDWRQVIILTSTQQALELAARLLLDSGDEVWLEEPGYLGARAALLSAEAKIIPAPVDDDGLNLDAVKARAKSVRLAYVTPSHQYPTGVTMSLTRRLALLDWAARSGAWIIEDDYDSEFRYTGRPLTSMQGLDQAARVVYTGTFNKVIFPALRLAYVVVPHGLVDAFTAARTLIDGYTPTFMQAVLADFINGGHFAAHIRRVRNVYRERRETLLDALDQYLSGELQVKASDTGLHLTGWLPKGTDDVAISTRAATRGLDVPPLSRYYLGRPSRPGLLLNYASVPPKAIRQGVRALAASLR